MGDKQKQVLWWGLVFLWMGVIFWFSAQNSDESSSMSGGVVDMLVNFIKILVPGLDDGLLSEFEDGLTFIVRKTAHASIYFGLGILVYTALGKNLPLGKRVLLTLVICFAYACSDEVHQLFIPGRSGEFRDVCIDTGGAGIGTLVAWGMTFFRKRRRLRLDSQVS